MANKIILCGSGVDASNAYWNNETNPPDQAVLTAGLLPAFLAYSIGGGIASVFNIVCIIIFLTKKELRKKYLLFAALAFGNLLNTLFCLIAGALRRKLIYANQFLQAYSTFKCMEQPGPHLQVLGGQLSALVLLAIALQRLFAVYTPILYKIHFSMRTRSFMVLICFAAALVSYLLSVLSSYLHREICVGSFCSPTAAFGYPYGNFHTIIVIILPVISLIINLITYIRAKRFANQESMKKELKMIRVTLAVTSIDVVLIAIPNILLFGTGNNLIVMNQSTLAYIYVLYCCNSATDLIVYVTLKREFRDHFLYVFSFGTLDAFLNKTPAVSGNRLVQNGGGTNSRRIQVTPRYITVTAAS